MSAETTENSSASGRRPKRRRMLWPRLFEILLLALAVFCLAVLITQDLGKVTGFLYSPLAVILLVVVFVEFLIIKGGDRSRLYRIELERMREREQDQVERTRKAVAEVDRTLALCRTRLQSADPEAPADASVATDIEESLKRIDKLLRPDLKE